MHRARIMHMIKFYRHQIILDFLTHNGFVGGIMLHRAYSVLQLTVNAQNFPRVEAFGYD
jgi:hypothetical protein